MILLDTNVLSEALKPAPEPRVVTWLDRRFPECAISTVTIFELRVGIELLDRGQRRDALERAVSRLVRRFGGRVYAFDIASAESAATLPGKARAWGLGLHQIPAKLADLQIAGVAAAYGLELATRNVGYFQGIGLKVLDPWAA